MKYYSWYKRKKFWICDYLKGAEMWKHYREVSKIIKNPESSESLRKTLLTDILKYAKENCSFYAQVGGEDLHSFPVINKDIIKANIDGIVVPTEKIPGQVGPVHVQKTSGSSGTPFEIFQDTQCRIRRIATIKAANERIGFHSFMPLMHLRSVKHYWGFPDNLTWKKDLNILYADNANLDDQKIKEILNAINDNGIKFIRGYMTTLNTLTEYAVKHNISLVNHPTFISGGELLLESLRKRVVEDLGCNIISQYANEENGVLGESPLNEIGTNIDLYLANCYIEVLKMDSDEPVSENEMGRIVVTDYTNHAMPMIRYDIGDLAMIDKRSATGEVLSLKKLAGRKTDLIYKTDGTAIDLFNSISPEVYNNPGVKQWQFIQTGKTEYTLTLALRDASLNQQGTKFENLIKQILGEDAIVKVEFVDDIQVMSSGKRKIVIQSYMK